MPYKDPEAKREWELKHRAERLARRRELHRINAAESAQQKDDPAGTGVLFLPILAGGALAAYSPRLALGAGGLILFAAKCYRKGWQWWFVGRSQYC
jgi:hypothetical protein